MTKPSVRDHPTQWMPVFSDSVGESDLPTRIDLLHLEDDHADAELVQEMLESAAMPCQITQVKTRAEFQAALLQNEYHVILADHNIPGYDGLLALRFAREHHPETPFIIVSGTMGEDVAIESLTAGATDYVLKHKLSRLVPAVKRALHESQNEQARRNAIQALRQSELQLREIVHNIPGIVYQLRTRPDGSYYPSYISPNARDTFDFASDEFELNWDDLKWVHPDDRNAFRESLLRSLTQRTPWNFEGRFLTTKNQARWFQGIASPLLLGREMVFNGILLDIQERKLAEQGLGVQLEHLRALNVINQAIIGSLDLKLTLSLFLGQVINQLHIDAADVLLFNRQLRQLEFGSSRGFRAERAKSMSKLSNHSYPIQIVTQRQSIEIGNLGTTVPPEVDSAMIQHEKFVAYVGIPLIAKGEVCGVLEVFHRSPLTMDADWLAFLKLLGNQAAISIDNAMLFDELQRTNHELQLAYDTTLEGWSAALDLRDKETEGHTARVTSMTVDLARLAGLSQEEITNARRGALLHDIGKMGIPDSILLKPGKLTDEEWVVMRKHPVYAFDLISPIPYLRPSLDIPYCHHEKWDGTGYPRGLAGEQIPLVARLFAIVDVWDALTSDRPYRPAWSKWTTLALIVKDAGTHFDPKCVEIFLRLLRESAPDLFQNQEKSP